MMTLVFETTRERAEALARMHLPEGIPMPTLRVVGRLVAVQSEFFDLIGEGSLRTLASSAGLPLRAIVDKPPFEDSPGALPKPEVRVTQANRPSSGRNSGRKSGRKPRRQTHRQPRLALMHGQEDP